MENKILTQELNLIEELLHLVNTKEEYDYLMARAKEIIPFWLQSSDRTEEVSPRDFEVIALSQTLKGGDRKMKVELQTTIDSYVELLEKIRERSNSNVDAIAIMAEIRKDQRSKQMQEKKVLNGNLPATENQIDYLEKLGMTEIPEDLNRNQASQMIDELKEKASYEKVLKAPFRVP